MDSAAPEGFTYWIDAVGGGHFRDYASLTLVRHVSISSTLLDRTHVRADLLELCEQRLRDVS